MPTGPVSFCQDVNSDDALRKVSFPIGMSEVQGERTLKVPFSADIKPIFRIVDISHMKPFRVELDNYAYTSNPDNATRVLAALSPRDGEPPTMPPGGPHMTPAQLAFFTEWQNGGYNPDLTTARELDELTTPLKRFLNVSIRKGYA